MLTALLLLQVAALDQACIAHADLAVSVVAAHARGVPLERTLSITDQMPDPYRQTVRDTILSVYSHEPVPVDFDQRRYADRVAAACITGAKQ